jgi:hypothetical protein
VLLELAAYYIVSHSQVRVERFFVKGIRRPGSQFEDMSISVLFFGFFCVKLLEVEE